ncbi:outer membrane beta-barrel protein [Planctomycetota bacterium]
MKNKTDSWFANPYTNASHLHLTSFQVLSPGGVDDTANRTSASSGRIYGTGRYLELTPMWGYTFGGRFENEENDEAIKISEESSFGFRLAYDYKHNSQIEFLYSHQETKLTGGDLFPSDALFDLDVNYYHIGGSLFWNRGSRLEPYFTGTLGLTHMNPEDSGVDSLTRFSMGFGGGVRYFPLERVGLYMGTRGLVTFVNSYIEVYSGSRDSYVIIESDTLWQFQVYAGLIFVF